MHEGPWVGTVRPEGSLNFFERVVDHIRTTYPYWDRNVGYDHIFVATVRAPHSLTRQVRVWARGDGSRSEV